jgi:hypothetical protein
MNTASDWVQVIGSFSSTLPVLSSFAAWIDARHRENPPMSFWIHGAIHAQAMLVLGRSGNRGPGGHCSLKVRVDVIDSNMDLRVNRRQVFGADEPHLLRGRGQHHGVPLVRHLGVADSAVRHRQAKALLKTERAAQELDRRGTVRIR